VPFETLLRELLPADLPHRDACVIKAARHLELIVETNQQFNLTRIVEEREAVIKHVVDSVLPWRLFAGAKHVVDAGTGAGFPGIPLAVVFPETRFTLIESTQKKARFVEAAVADLNLANVEVLPVRAEDWLSANAVEIVTARAVAPLSKAIPLFAPAWKRGARLLLYKGPDAEAEIAEAAMELRKRKAQAAVKFRYELPDNAGSRGMIEVTPAQA
jgi:16S rRNA (guanine527-N7)-methyltransferase